MSAFEKSMRNFKGGVRRMILPFAVTLAAFFALLPYGVSSVGADELLLYDGDYSETQIMHHMIKFLVEDKEDIKVTIQDQMSQVNNFSALTAEKNSCDMMISYDGTLLTTFLHLDPEDVPEGESIYSYSNKTAAEKHNVRLLEKLGFDNTYAIAVPQHVAEKYGLETVSDLIPVAGELVFGAEHEFFTEEGSMKFNPFTEFYGLKFKDAVSVDVSLKYAAVEKGSFDVTEVYATDGLNRKANLKVLEDDKSFFPDYNGAFLVREDTFEKFEAAAPNLEEVLNMLAGQISNNDMVEMTYQVDVMSRDIDEVALEFLTERGIISK